MCLDKNLLIFFRLLICLYRALIIFIIILYLSLRGEMTIFSDFETLLFLLLIWYKAQCGNEILNNKFHLRYFKKYL